MIHFRFEYILFGTNVQFDRTECIALGFTLAVSKVLKNERAFWVLRSKEPFLRVPRLTSLSFLVLWAFFTGLLVRLRAPPMRRLELSSEPLEWSRPDRRIASYWFLNHKSRPLTRPLIAWSPGPTVFRAKPQQTDSGATANHTRWESPFKKDF